MAGEALTSDLKAAGIRINIGSKDRGINNVTVEHLWRNLKYEEACLKVYGTATQKPGHFCHHHW